MGKIAEIEGTRLLQEVLAFLGSDKRILVFQGGTRCFTGDTLVRTGRGLIPISQVAVGDEVPAGGEVTEVFQYDVEDHCMVRLTLLDGTSFACTYDHEILSSGAFHPAIVVALMGVVLGADLYESDDVVSDCGPDGGGVGRSIEPREIVSVSLFQYTGTIYDLNVFPDNQYLITQSSRLVHNSGKSYAIAQGLNVHFQWMRRDTPPNERFRYSIMRKRMPSLKGTAMRDYFEVMERHGWYSQRSHNKTDSEYRDGNVETEFLSLDDPQKIRGRKRNVVWMNEANEFTFEDFKQIAFRTTGKLLLDYNPSEEYHWIYDKILVRDDVHYVQSTYRDNPFLTPETVREIEWLQEVDENAWRIYGKGERGSSGAAIYPRFEVCDSLPGKSDPIYGVDFGYNEPSAVVEIEQTDIDGELRLYMRERLYETKLTVRDMISRLGEIVGAKYHRIYGDSASPDRIEEIFRAGYNITGADKRNYSVKDGIDFIKRHKIYITADSENLIRELRGYKWKQDNQDRILDEPVKFRDHALDAARYAAYTHHGNPVTWLME